MVSRVGAWCLFLFCVNFIGPPCFCFRVHRMFDFRTMRWSEITSGSRPAPPNRFYHSLTVRANERARERQGGGGGDALVQCAFLIPGSTQSLEDERNTLPSIQQQMYSTEKGVSNTMAPMVYLPW